MPRIFFSVAIVLSFVGCASVHRSDYGVTREDISGCKRTEILALPKVYPPPEIYDQEEIANIYIPYAVAALNAYAYKAPDGSTYESDGELSRFTLSAYSASWSRQPRIVKPSGLTLDYYFNDDDPEVLKILIAFRGTESSSAGDWFSNLSWITQLIPIKNQYDYAREAVSEVRARARVLAKGKKLTMLTTGHSLGGGLAEHVAYAFPCVSAVVFNSSFVVNRFRLAEPFDDAQVVHIFDKNDELTFLRRLFLSDSESPTYKRYGINPVARGGLQHKSEPLAVGMARMVAMCQSDPNRVNPPGCPKSDQRARRLYCESNYAKHEQQEAQCKF